MADDEGTDELPPYVPPVNKPSILDQLAGISMKAGDTVSDNAKQSDGLHKKAARVRRKSRDLEIDQMGMTAADLEKYNNLFDEKANFIEEHKEKRLNICDVAEVFNKCCQLNIEEAETRKRLDLTSSDTSITFDSFKKLLPTTLGTTGA